MDYEMISCVKAHGGEQRVYRHPSKATGTDMEFSVFVPDRAQQERLPVVWFLSGLTCTPMNVTEKGEFRQACSELGLILVAPDTSPRGDGVADDPEGAYDLGLGAGFYVDATEAPWAAHYQMRTYIEQELPAVVASLCPADLSRQGITGHSMGGHGALTIGLRNPERFRSVSAFAPICSPMQCAWGEKALSAYIGEDRTRWRQYDACALIADGVSVAALLVDQGTTDTFVENQLKPELLESACREFGQTLTLRRQAGYDHSYYFIASFMAEHLRWHHKHLN
ncbi:MAG: S-formylglutathione hydrolase [Pseudomonadota bacterium]